MAKTSLLIISLVLLLGVFQVTAAPPVGWRTDGTGRYPDASPPIKWSVKSNVVWKTPMPGWGNATPVIVGDRLFVCSEQTRLVCVGITDGRILWQKTNTYLDVLAAKGPARAGKDKSQAGVIVSKFKPLEREMCDVKRQLEKSPDNAGLKEKSAKLYKQIRDLNTALTRLPKYRLPRTEPVCGYSSSTPVSDGKNVYAVFGTGVVACYDLVGNRKWIKLIEKPTHTYGHGASPLLVGNKLIVRLVDLIGIEAKNGKVLWRIKTKPWWGTPVHTRIGNVDVIITPGGDIVRIADGKVLANRLAKLYSDSPITGDDVVYFVETSTVAIRLPSKASEKITPKRIWRTSLKNDIYYASPVIHKGLIYAITQHNIFSVVDAGAGQVVYKKKLNLGGGTVYPSITLAGKHLFVSSANGTTLVLEPGREYRQIARNTLEPFRSSPVFRGKRMYVRGLRCLYCIGKD